MNKLILICILIGVYAYTITVGYLIRGQTINSLETENKSLQQEIERVNNAKQKAAETIVRIQNKLAQTQEPCDCYHTPLPAGDILEWVRGSTK